MKEVVDEINEAAEQLGISDMEITGPEDLDIQPSQSSEPETVSVTLFRDINPREKPVSDINRRLVRDGVDWDITIKHRPRCPSCGTTASSEEDGPHLAGTCRVCGKKVCAQCRCNCSGCGQVMCDQCSTGHGLEQETFCQSCRNDVEEEVLHNRNLEQQKQEFKEKKQLLEHSRQVRKDKVQKKLKVLRVLKELRQQQLRSRENQESALDARFSNLEQRANQLQPQLPNQR